MQRFPPVVRERLRDLASLARRAGRSDGIAIALERDGEYVCCARAGERAPALGASLDVQAGFSAECVRTGTTLVCRDTESDSRVDAAVCRRLSVRSIVAVPLKCAAGTVGLVEAFSAQPEAFDESAVQVLERLSQAVIAAVATEYEPPDEPAGPDRHQDAEPAVADAPEPQFPPAAEDSGLNSTDEPTSVLQRLARWTRAHKLLLIVAVAVVGLGGFTAVRTIDTRPQTPATVDAGFALRTAAEQGDAAAQYRLALDIEDGHAPAREPTEWFEWLQRAANQRNADAQYRLGTVLAEGQGVPADPVAAYTWYTVAGLSGNQAGEAAARALAPSLTPSQIAAVRFNLGRMYAAGIAVPQDYVSAYTWLTLAEEVGSGDATAAKSDLAGRMTREQVSEATHRAVAWLARHRSEPRAGNHGAPRDADRNTYLSSR